MIWLVIISVAVGHCALILFLWQLSDIGADRIVWKNLLQQAGPAGPAFDPAFIAELPELAQRYFRYTIAPGTPLVSVVEIDMEGQLGLGTKDKPSYRPMKARQILTPPLGLVWKVQAGPISGSDGARPDRSWTRFWFMNFLPVVRVSGISDHHRSAFGRIVAESAFWVPASLLPGSAFSGGGQSSIESKVSWEAVDENTARAIVSFGRYKQSVELTIEADGRPSRVMIQRWSNENTGRVFREQPFGGYLSDFREIGGYRLPMRVEGGNLIGTDDYFPFYKAEVREIRFPQLNRPKGSTGAD